MKLFNNKNRILWFVFLFSLSILALLSIILGIRGRIEIKSPLRVGTAYFSNNNFLNQLGLNPNFILMQSYFDAKKLDNQHFVFMDTDSAINIMKQNLGITDSIHSNPFARKTSISNNFTQSTFSNSHPNVILILMESMSASKMKRHGNTANLTPFLDNLSNIGWYFENFYSTGIHTYCGIFSSLYSLPTIFLKNPLKRTPILEVQGLPHILKQNNYTTVFFSAHDAQFDNMNGFLYGNGFDKIIEKSDYPQKEIVSPNCVPDDFMFHYSINVYNKLALQGKPFFSTMLTISDHIPYHIPKYFHAKNADIKEQIVEYADYSLRKFIELSKKQAWFSNTIFVFVADHGVATDITYDLPLSYYHIPFLIYYPKLHNSDTNSMSNNFNNISYKLGSQVDIAATVTTLLGISHINYGFGVNLFEEKRNFIVLTGDNKYGVLNEEYLLIIGKDGSKALYKYKIADKTNRINEQRNLATTMELYGKAYLQSFDYLVRNSTKSNK